MSEAQILVAEQDAVVVIRIIGRATFQLSQKLREFGGSVFDGDATNLIFDLSACAGMDSTILGVLAMIGLEGRGKAGLFLVNVPPTVLNTLKTIGVTKLYTVSGQAVPKVDWCKLCEAAADTVNMNDVGDTVLDAHKTLMELDPKSNVPKFKDLVEMLDTEIRKKDV